MYFIFNSVNYSLSALVKKKNQTDLGLIGSLVLSTDIREIDFKHHFLYFSCIYAHLDTFLIRITGFRMTFKVRKTFLIFMNPVTLSK